MSIVAQVFKFVVGVDTHARKHVFSIISAVTGGLVDSATFPASPAGNARAATWIGRRTKVDPDAVLVSMEGTAAFGAVLRAHLEDGGYRVVEAPPPLRRSARRGKDDAIDAHRAATAVLGVETSRLTCPREGGIRQALRVLLVSREGVNTQVTAQINQLTALVRTMDLGVDARRALSRVQIRQIAAWRVRNEAEYMQICRAEAVRLAQQIIAGRRDLEANKAQIQDLILTYWPELLDMVGVGPITAARFVIVWSHHGRVRSEAAFASLAGASPIPASSGNNKRMRLNRGGDRALNNALHTVVLVRLSWDDETKAYMAKRIAEGRSKRDVIRILKRYAARQIYRTLNRIERAKNVANLPAQQSTDLNQPVPTTLKTAA